MRVEVALPLSETPDARYLREVRVLVDDEWRTIASEEFTVEVPEWAEAEPLWSLVVLIAVPIILLAGVSLVSTRVVRHHLDDYDDQETPVRHIRLVGADGLGAPIVRLGFFVWRSADVESDGETDALKAHVSLAWFVVGPLAARFYSPPDRMDATDDMQPPGKLTRLVRRGWVAVRGTRTLVVGRRLTGRSFETAGDHEASLELVRSLDYTQSD